MAVPRNAKYYAQKATANSIASASIVDGAIVNADINAAAAIAFSKLAALASTKILVGNASNVATAVTVTGDVTIGNTGVTAIGAGKVTNAMLEGSIATSKLLAADHGVGLNKVEFMAVGEYDFADAKEVVVPSATGITHATDLFTKAAHGLVDGDVVNVTTSGALPTGLSVDTAYYVRKISADSFKLYDTRAHALDTGAVTGLVEITDNGTGDQTFLAGAGIGQHALGVTLPDNAIITGGFVDVLTTFKDEDNDSATIAIQVQGANDIVNATAISAVGNIWDAGLRDVIPDATGSTAVKTDAAREMLMVVADDQLEAGKMRVYLRYVQGI